MRTDPSSAGNQIAMQDDDARSHARRPPKAKGPAPDDEASAELSRAAREAVRQPPDPRLERQFAHLALWGEPEGSEAAPLRAAGSESGDAEAGRLRAALVELGETLGELRATSARLERRLDVVNRWLVGLTAAVVILAVLVLVRWLG